MKTKNEQPEFVNTIFTCAKLSRTWLFTCKHTACPHYLCRPTGEHVFACCNYGLGITAPKLHVAYRSKNCDCSSYRIGCSVTQFSDIQFTDSELDD